MIEPARSSAALIAGLAPAARQAGFLLHLCGPEELTGCIQSLAERGRMPCVAVVGPENPRPLQLARHLYRLVPGAKVVLLAAGEHQEELRRVLARLPVARQCWDISEPRAAEFSAALDRSLRARGPRPESPVVLERRLAVQYAVARLLADAEKLGQAAPRLLQMLCASLDWDRGVIWRNEEGAPARLAGYWDRGGIGPTEAEQRPGRSNDRPEFSSSQREPQWIRYPGQSHGGFLTILRVPIPPPGRTAGRMEFYSRSARRPDHEHSDMMAAVAAQLGEFLQRQRARDAQQKRTEEMLQNSEKLAATGRMAASIAHEINNPLEAVTNLMYLLEHHPTLDEQARSYLGMAQEELARIVHITRQTLGFYRESRTPLEMSLAEVLDSVLQLYSRRIGGKGVRVQQRYEDGLQICGFPVELRQVFSNLIVNAVEAMPSGGILCLHAYPSRDWRHPEREGVRVVVADNGPGIGPEHLRRIFEPFYTTKGERGTGLGLWVSKGIVQKHGGAIEVRSRQKRPGGTVFSVFLPRAYPAYQPQQAA